MATTREQRLTCEALTENPAGASRNMITVPTDSVRDQLARLEDALDRILRILAPLVGAR